MIFITPPLALSPLKTTPELFVISISSILFTSILDNICGAESIEFILLPSTITTIFEFE